MFTTKHLIALGFLAFWAAVAQAQGEIYKCPDPSGRPTYTNVKRDTAGKNCTMVSREVSVVPSFPMPRTAQAGTSRNESRRKILESELDSEQKLLSDAKQKLAEQEATRDGEERNYARVQERLKPYQDSVQQHEKNIEQLQRELALSR
jgi:septal ring factor EnvC (AmiA/AmiB activator)